MSDRHTSEINAGSMADIAFLLLIFFLVTTTLDTDEGMQKMLSKKVENEIRVNERNVLEITINANNEILLENVQTILLADLKQHIIAFIDNGGATDLNGNRCDWCNGQKESKASDHPAKAIIEVESSRNTSYATYIAVHNEINAAYTNLRDRLSLKRYNTPFKDLENSFESDKSDLVLKAKFDDIREKYPIHISEKEPIN